MRQGKNKTPHKSFDKFSGHKEKTVCHIVQKYQLTTL